MCPLKDHFEQSQFEEIAKSSAGRKKLKPNAIPTLFCVRNPPYPAVTTPYIRLTPLKDEPGMTACRLFSVRNLSSWTVGKRNTIWSCER